MPAFEELMIIPMVVSKEADTIYVVAAGRVLVICRHGWSREELDPINCDLCIAISEVRELRPQCVEFK